MLFDLTLILVGIGSTGVLWYRVSQKIPELVAIPDDVIIDRLHEDSARIRVFLLNARRYLREREYRPLFLQYAEKALHRLHILMLRLDNGTVLLLKKVRALLGETNGNGSTSASAHVAQEPQGKIFPAPPIVPAIKISTHPRIHEVRRRRTPRQDTSMQQKLPE